MSDLYLPRSPIPVYTDNKGTYDIVRNPGVTARTRHFERWLHYMRYLFSRNFIDIVLVSTNDMYADIFTKAVSRHILLMCRRFIMNEDAFTSIQ